ncbi:hypothetical protein WJX73_003703 [Symbiochloris irregularis]|uniref:Uncharacterized protein n=1 Tax=Symbiochloris irregularis TaxID=706552 RepID=A0AAW1PQC8_9CHLO
MSLQHTTSFSGAPAPGKDVRCGVVRDSMKTNATIQSQYCEMRRTQFSQTAPSSLFGRQSSADHEGVREAIHQWRHHTPETTAVPELDFKTMNKLAAVKGVTGAREQRSFRAQHPRHIKPPSGPPDAACSPSLPKNKANHPTFGGPSVTDPASAPAAGDAQYTSLLPVLQGAHQNDWIKANIARSRKVQPYIPPGKTLASLGHATASRNQAEITLLGFNGTSSLDKFKMPRFLSVPAVVDTHRLSGTAY